MNAYTTGGVDDPTVFYIDTPYGWVGVSRYMSTNGYRTHAFPVEAVPDSAREWAE